jgi:hypothetical protein
LSPADTRFLFGGGGFYQGDFRGGERVEAVNVPVYISFQAAHFRRDIAAKALGSEADHQKKL